jgi:PPK2 family polyphosphate:nucleotide phosphotransferase
MDDERRRRVSDFIEPFRVRPGAFVKLARDFDPAFTAAVTTDTEGDALLRLGVNLLSEYQTRLAAESRWGVVVVLQAIDAAGKDGTIRHLLSVVNPQGVQVTSFKAPSAEDLAHDFLWRYARRLPARGSVAIFNRSHYEEVLVVRVHPELLVGQRIPAAGHIKDVWRCRYRAINDWERYLAENGFRVVKLFLNLSYEEQRTRFLRRLELSDHSWRFSVADAREREYWEEYQLAFSEMLSHTSTEWAPWYVIPADRSRLERIAVGAVLAHALMEIDPQYPSVSEADRHDLLAAKMSLAAKAANGPAVDPFLSHRQSAGEVRVPSPP